jgi:putative spermidine/putrescine transport system permease protein
VALDSTDAATGDGAAEGPVRRLSAALYRRRWLKLILLLVGPLGWLIGIYLVALGTLLIYGFWSYDDFTSSVDHVWTLSNFRQILTDPDPTLRDVAVRTVKIAALVTIIDAIIAFPLAYYMTRVAGGAARRLLLLAILMPLFSSYLVRVYAWRLILDDQGALSWSLEKLGLHGVHLGFSQTAVLITFCYAWLPFMVLPVYGALERIPGGLLEASGDLGGRGFTTFRRVVLPLALPGVIAGSIFTFSLTLGDFLTPILVGNTQFIGNVIYADVGNAGNLPAAAAYAMVPVAIMGVYLTAARRLGAFESL